MRSAQGLELTQWVSCLSVDSSKLKCHGMLVQIPQVQVGTICLDSELARQPPTTTPPLVGFGPLWQLGSLRLVGCAASLQEPSCFPAMKN